VAPYGTVYLGNSSELFICQHDSSGGDWLLCVINSAAPVRESCPEAATSRFDASPHHLRRHLRGARQNNLVSCFDLPTATSRYFAIGVRTLHATLSVCFSHVARRCCKSARHWFATAAYSNSTQITDGCGVGQLLCFRCMQTITADTVIAYVTHNDRPNISSASSRYGAKRRGGLSSSKMVSVRLLYDITRKPNAKVEHTGI